MKRIAPGASSETRSAACGRWSTSSTLSPRARNPRTAARPMPVAPPAMITLPMRESPSARLTRESHRQAPEPAQARLQPELRRTDELDVLHLLRQGAEEYFRFEPRHHL